MLTSKAMYSDVSTTDQFERITSNLKSIHSRMPTQWRPTFAAFIRLGNADFAVATNHTFPIYLRCRAAPNRKSRLWDFFFSLRKDYIKKHSPRSYDGEHHFSQFVKGPPKRRTIQPEEWQKRQALFDYRTSSSNAQGSEYWIYGRAYNLNTNKFRAPCVKCAWVYRGVWFWNAPEGPVRWEGFPECNCGESLAYALAVTKLDNFINADA
jgi:hypothetical protein